MDRKYIKLLIISFVFMVICLGRNNALNVYAVELPVIPIGEESSESNDNSNKEDTQLPIVEENEESSGQKDTTENKKDDSKKQENGQTEEKSGTNKKTDTNAGSSTDGKADTNTGSDTDQKDNKGSDKKSDHVTSEKKTDDTDKKSDSSDLAEDTDNTLPVMAPDGGKPILGGEVTINENAEKSSAGQESKKEVSEADTENSTAESSSRLAVWIIAGLVVLGIAGVVFWRKKR